MNPSRIFTRINRFAPLVCAIMLVALMGLHQTSGFSEEQVEAYHERIKQAAREIPYKIGENWHGIDRDITPAAQRLLRPNVLFQRTYTNQITKESADLLFVHCGYIRDMQGHYPPNCYPAHGWQKSGQTPTTIRIGPSQYPANRFTFDKSFRSQQSEIVVTNFFIVASEEQPVLRDMGDLRRLGERRRRNALGSAQVQVVTSSEMPAAEREEVVALFLEALKPIVETIGDGVKQP